MQIARKYLSILIYGTILNDAMRSFLNLALMVKPARQEKHLQIKRPAMHVIVEVAQVRIIIHAFEIGLPLEVVRQKLSQRTLPGADITCYSDIFLSGIWHNR